MDFAMNNNTSFVTNHICSHKYSFILDNILRRIFQHPKKIISPYIQTGDVVVDIGCGAGFFSIEMARLVGNRGRVYAVDLQPEMLEKVNAKSARHHLDHVIETVQCEKDDLNLPKDVQADFILAYYMVHETGAPDSFFRQIEPVLKTDGKFLVVEPPFHVSAEQFNHMAKSAQNAGFTILDRPRKKGGASLLLGKGQAERH